MTGMPLIEIPLETLRPGVPLRTEDGANGIVVIRGEDCISAFEDVCPHARWRLSGGEVCAGVLECPGHGWEFDVKTGRCLNVPAYRLRHYDVVVEDGMVRIMCSEAPYPAHETAACIKALGPRADNSFESCVRVMPEHS